MNASFDGSPCRFQLDSGHVVLIDPLALDGLSSQLADVGKLPESERSSKLQALGEHGLRIGVQAVSGAAPGMYQIDLDSFEAVTYRERRRCAPRALRRLKDAAPSNRRLQPTAADAIMSRRG